MSTPRHPNLEGAFAPSGRGANLEGLLKPRRAIAPEPAAAAPAEQKPTPSEPAQPGAGRTKRARKPATGTDRPLNVAAYLPPAILDAAQTQKRTTGEQYADLLAHAFDTVDKQALRAAFTPEPAAASKGGMPPRAVRARGAAGIQRQFRLTAEQRDWLDEQVRAYNAPSRSAFIATVLGLHFDIKAQQ